MARFLDRLGLSDPALVFHPFRHGFKSACRRAELPREVHDYLTGHSGGTVGERYGEEHLPRVARAMVAFRRSCTKMSSTTPCWSTAGQR
jgi:integrase